MGAFSACAFLSSTIWSTAPLRPASNSFGYHDRGLKRGAIKQAHLCMLRARQRGQRGIAGQEPHLWAPRGYSCSA